MVFFVDCEKCQSNKDCDKKPDTQRQILFSYAKGQSTSCDGYDPVRYHGIEGVAA